MLTGELVGDSGRTVRSLSAASKPRITQRTTRYTPSIQVEGAGHIFTAFLFIFLKRFCTFGQVKRQLSVSVGRDSNRPTKVVEFVKLIWRP